MDAKSKANFINSVAGGQETVCANCGGKNSAESKFCVICGSSLAAAPAEESAPAFAPVEEDAPAFAPVEEAAPAFAPVEDNAPAFAPVKETVAEAAEKVEVKSVNVEKEEEPISVFAQGLPAWSLEPPQVMVRRR